MHVSTNPNGAEQPAPGNHLPPGWTGRFQSVPLRPEDAREMLEPLSHREEEVLSLATLGLYNQAIGSRLFLSESTIKSHLSGAFHKMGVESRLAARSIACAAGLSLRALRTDELPHTKSVLAENKLGLAKVKVMNAFELTIEDFQFLSWTARGLSAAGCASRFGVSESAVKSRANILYRHLGVTGKKGAHIRTGIVTAK